MVEVPQKIDLSKMNLAELMELRKSLDKAMASAEKAARKKALEDAQKAAQKHGFDLGELVNGQSKQGMSKAKAPPKFCNPNNASETWSGRGRQPEWFRAAVEAGIPREKMAI